MATHNGQPASATDETTAKETARDVDESHDSTDRPSTTPDTTASSTLATATAVAATSSKEVGRLWCGLCDQVLRCPRLLPSCHHCFCLHCLENLAAQQGDHSLCCPTCQVVPLPSAGVSGLKENKFLLESELEQERDRTRPGAAKVFCERHPEEKLAFFCETDSCRQLVCLHCAITNHGSHKIIDLRDAAERAKEEHLSACKERLDSSVRTLRTALAEVEASQEDAELKAERIKVLIHSLFEDLIRRAKHHRDHALQNLDTIMADINNDLDDNKTNINRHLQSVLRLQQQVEDSLNSSNEVQVVRLASIVSENEGSARQLQAIERSLPTMTSTPSLQWDDSSVSDRDLCSFFGAPERVELPFKACGVQLSPFFQCEAPPGSLSGKEVHFLHITQSSSMHVAFGGTAPHFQEEQLVTVSEHGTKGKILFVKKWPTFNRGHAILPQISSNPSAPGTRVIFANSRPHWSLSYKFNQQTNFLRFKTETPLSLGGSEICLPISFDISEGFSVDRCALVSERQAASDNNSCGHVASEDVNVSSWRTNQRSVQLFSIHYYNGRCVLLDNYSPGHLPFHPTAISFLKNKADLLIADLATDTVHLVNTSRHELQLLCYIGAGSPLLVRPTALDTRLDTVAIGCQDGRVLTCSLRPEAFARERRERGGEQDDEDDALDGDRGLTVDNRSTCTTGDVDSLLAVDNMSTATADTFRLAED